MNRRNFLKSIATVCGAAVVCPGELLKSPVDPWIRLAALRKKNAALGIRGERAKHAYMADHPIFVKARQQGCTNSILYGIPYYFRGVPIYYQENLSA